LCIICGETRVAEWAHLISVKVGGPFAEWNLIPLCPTHHKCFDTHCLDPEEISVIKPYLEEAEKRFKTQQSSGALVDT
jgi:hypothetical protein